MIRAAQLLNLRRLRRQPVRALITIAAVAAGVSLAVSILIVMNSLTTAFEGLGRQLAGPAPLRVVGATVRGGIHDSVIEKVARTPGVAAAIPVVQAVVLADDSRGGQRPILAFGVDCRVEELLGPLGCDQASLAAATDAPPVVSAALARELGPSGAIRSDLGRIPIAGAPSTPQLDDLNQGRVAVFPLPTAKRQFIRPETVDVIYVTARPGTDLDALRDRLEVSVGSHNGVLGASDPPAEAGIVTQIFIPLFGVLSMFSLGVGAVLVFNTVALSLEERRRQLAITGALGAGRRLLLGGTLAEAGGLGLLGGLLGVAGGIAVAYPVTSSLNDFTEKGLGMPVPVAVAGRTVVIGALLGLVLGMASAIVPARRALRMDIAAELSNRDLRAETAPRARWRRVAIATAFAGLGLGLCFVAQQDGALERWQAVLAPVAFLTMVLALCMLVGALAPIVVGVAGRRVARASAATRLGMANLAREPGRTGVMAVAIGLAVGVAFVLATFHRSVREGITENIGASGGEWIRVSTLEPNNTINIDSGVPPDLVAALEKIPGAREVQRTGGLISGHTPGTLTGVTGADGWAPEFEILRGRFDRARYEAGEVMIGPALARSTGARPGDTIRLDTPRGPVEVPVLGVWQDGDFGGRSVTMDLTHIERIFGAQPTLDVIMRPEPGVSTSELVDRVRAARLDPTLHVQTSAELADVVADDVGNQLASFWAIQRSLLLVAFVAVLSTLLLVGAQRRRELGLLAAVGMGPRDLGRMVVSEAGTMAATGVGLGILAGAVMCFGLIAVTVVMIGYRDPLVFDFGAIPGAAAIAVAIVLLAAAIPALRTARVEVVEALQYE